MTAPLPLISRSGSGSGELWFNIRILEDVESPTISRAKEELTNKVFKTQSVILLIPLNHVMMKITTPESPAFLLVVSSMIGKVMRRQNMHT